MPLQPPRCGTAVLTRVLAAAGVALAVASCTSHVTPLGPDGQKPTPTTPAPARHLGSPIILQVMRSRPATAPGKCPAGYVALSTPGYSGTCYRNLGKPVMITSAAVSSVSVNRSSTSAGQPKGTASYVFTVTVPAPNVAAVTAVIKQAYDVRGALALNVAGKIWDAPQVDAPFPGQQLQFSLPSRNQALRLHRILIPPS
jgi:hypothetical protein